MLTGERVSHLEAFMFYVGSGCFVQDRVQPLLCRPHMSNNFGTDHPSPLKRVSPNATGFVGGKKISAKTELRKDVLSLVPTGGHWNIVYYCLSEQRNCKAGVS